ncbi:uncharacterized protein KZ484_009635 isoform 2-T2 [Pholidichthys leucotaenia]
MDQDSPWENAFKEEDEQQLLNQDRSSKMDQEEAEFPRIKEEEEELCICQRGEQLFVKPEADTFMVTPGDEERCRSEPEPNDCRRPRTSIWRSFS